MSEIFPFFFFLQVSLLQKFPCISEKLTAKDRVWKTISIWCSTTTTPQDEEPICICHLVSIVDVFSLDFMKMANILCQIALWSRVQTVQNSSLLFFFCFPFVCYKMTWVDTTLPLMCLEEGQNTTENRYLATRPSCMTQQPLNLL